jgi:hypothetical protein
MPDPAKLNAVVTLRTEVFPWLMILQVVPDGGILPDYVAGQCMSLGLFGAAPRCALADPETPPADPDKLIRRAYPIASSPASREFLELYVALVPGGVLTPRLFNLKIGDPIWLSQKPAGRFTAGDLGVPAGSNLVLIAISSGLAPEAEEHACPDVRQSQDDRVHAGASGAGRLQGANPERTGADPRGEIRAVRSAVTPAWRT